MQMPCGVLRKMISGLVALAMSAASQHARNKAWQSPLSVAGRAWMRSAAEDVHPSPPSNTIAPWGRIKLLTIGIAGSATVAEMIAASGM